MALATGQFTIIDYSDAISLSGYLSSNKSKNIMFNPDTKTSVPEFSTGNMVLTPSLFAAGVGTEICFNNLSRVTQQAWFYSADGGARVAINTAGTTTVGDGTMWGVVLGVNTTTSPSLTVKKNPLGSATDSPVGPALAVTGITYIWECTYTDPNMPGLPLKFTMSFDNTKNSNSSSIANANCWAPQGNIFKNALIPTLTAQCDLWRGATIDSTLVQYFWYKNDPATATTTSTGTNSTGAKTINVTSGTLFYVGQYVGITNGTVTDIVGPLTSAGTALTWTQGSGLANTYTAGATVFDGRGGNGWRLITNGGWAGAITGANSTLTATDGTNTISIPAAAVTNVGTFKCVIVDNDPVSPSYLSAFQDVITFNDQTDPVMVQIVSTNGDVFKNAIGSTVLIAKLFQNGAEIDTTTGTTEVPPASITYGASASRPGSGNNPSWYMANDTGVLTKYTTSWGASIPAISGYSKSYTWTIRDDTGAFINFGATSTSASLNYTDYQCTTLTASGGTAAGKYRKGKWILIDANDIYGKNTIQCDVI